MDAPLELLFAEPLQIKGLTPKENREIEQRRREALAATGRIELDCSAMQLLAQHLAVELGEFPPDAVNTFYDLRDELPADIPDAEPVDALVAATLRLGGDVEAVDIPQIAHELRQEYDAMSSYWITDDTGYTYRWNPQHWSYDEFASGWNGERWEDDHDL